MNEETKIEKKQWQKPELVVLVRATPEETVLSTCRFGPSFGGGDRSTRRPRGMRNERLCILQRLHGFVGIRPLIPAALRFQAIRS
jgi:hypothetical protein